jgi:S-formylglutathione hydrolase FrmB
MPVDDADIADLFLRQRDRLPPLRFDCGTEDPLIEANRKLHLDLMEHGMTHGYQEFAGGHEWPYWERHLVDTLEFFAGILEKERPRDAGH